MRRTVPSENGTKPATEARQAPWWLGPVVSVLIVLFGGIFVYGQTSQKVDDTRT